MSRTPFLKELSTSIEVSLNNDLVNFVKLVKSVKNI